MAITREQVRHIALLARLHLTPEEEAAFTEQLDHILVHFQQLEQLDTTAVEPTAHVIDVEAPYRRDEVRNPPAVEPLLANAPARDGRYFKVPKIIE
jgi:aspartyl-tRNA(Asn)/glutamyl-tRNA(Gln) amidotransferase subunit C